MKTTFFTTILTAATLLTTSALVQAAQTSPLSPSYGRDKIVIAEYVNPNAMRYVNAANPLDARFTRTGKDGNWVATATTTKSGYRDVTNPLHPSFKRS